MKTYWLPFLANSSLLIVHPTQWILCLMVKMSSLESFPSHSQSSVFFVYLLDGWFSLIASLLSSFMILVISLFPGLEAFRCGVQEFNASLPISFPASHHELLGHSHKPPGLPKKHFSAVDANQSDSTCDCIWKTIWTKFLFLTPGCRCTPLVQDYGGADRDQTCSGAKTAFIFLTFLNSFPSHLLLPIVLHLLFPPFVSPSSPATFS